MRIDKIQKEELKGLWKSKVYIPECDAGPTDAYLETLNYTEFV